jgi:2-methylisocitrate lyase-like PEP mutase family enzyme
MSLREQGQQNAFHCWASAGTGVGRRPVSGCSGQAGFGQTGQAMDDQCNQQKSRTLFERERMKTQAQKSAAFEALHRKGNCFVIPNPWDIGSARLLEHLGFGALASTSAGFAFSQGQSDLSTGLAAKLEHLSSLAAATQLPISADLQNGFGHAPEVVARTIIAAAKTGIVGGSIEDATGDKDKPIYDLALAVERIRSAADAARSQDVKFMLTARAENYLYGQTDLKDTIRRLQAYQEAGADVLFAPGIQSQEDIRAIVQSVDRPLNVIMGMKGVPLTLDQLRELGVTRVSLGGSLARAAYGALCRAAAEIQSAGTFRYADDAMSGAALNAVFADQPSDQTRESAGGVPLS